MDEIPSWKAMPYERDENQITLHDGDYTWNGVLVYFDELTDGKKYHFEFRSTSVESRQCYIKKDGKDLKMLNVNNNKKAEFDFIKENGEYSLWLSYVDGVPKLPPVTYYDFVLEEME